MKLFSLLPKRLVHFACNSPPGQSLENSTKRWISPACALFPVKRSTPAAQLFPSPKSAPSPILPRVL